MIDLIFKNIHIEGFQSLNSVDINFEELGLCLIQGHNKCDEFKKSNGAGKTSCFEALYWCLFGKTSKGLTNKVVNKNSKNGCYVKLTLVINGILYTIKRSISHYKYGNCLIILKNDKNISAKNKTDNEKLIKSILKINNETFLQFIYLSQGFNNRLAIYTPKIRKELLENMYGLNDSLNIFVNKLKRYNSKLNDEYMKVLSLDYELNGKITSLESFIELQDNNIVKLLAQIKDEEHKRDEFDETIYNEQNIQQFKSEIDNINKQIQIYITKKQKVEEILNKYQISVSQLNNTLINIENKIKNLKTTKVCPTCGRPLELDKEHTINLSKQIEELTNSLEGTKKLINDHKSQIEIYTIKQNKINECLQEYNTELNVLNNKFDDLNKKLIQRNKFEIIIENYKNHIKSYENDKKIKQDELQDIKKYKQDNLDLKHDIEIKQNALNLLTRLANNQFKAYLLLNIINGLNSKLNKLSIKLFSSPEDIIHITDDNNFNIMLGDKLYEQLSGGEQRLIDIALIIVQRQIAQQMNSVSSNILILDEVFDGLDEYSFNTILNILNDEIYDVESTFIISHRYIQEIPFDNIINVVKNENQMSEIVFV